MKCYFLLARVVLNVDNVKMWGEPVLLGMSANIERMASCQRMNGLLSAIPILFLDMVRRPYPNIFVRTWSPDYAPYFFVTLRIAGL